MKIVLQSKILYHLASPVTMQQIPGSSNHLSPQYLLIVFWKPWSQHSRYVTMPQELHLRAPEDLSGIFVSFVAIGARSSVSNAALECVDWFARRLTTKSGARSTLDELGIQAFS